MIAMVHELDSACEASQLRNNLPDQCRIDERLWILLPESFQITSIRPIRQYEEAFAMGHRCYSVNKMWMIAFAQLAEVLRFHLPCITCGQPLVVVFNEVLE